MQFWEIIIVIAIVAFVATVFGIRIYKIASGKAVDECASCGPNAKKMLKAYRKKYGKKKVLEENACCSTKK